MDAGTAAQQTDTNPTVVVNKPDAVTTATTTPDGLETIYLNHLPSLPSLLLLIMVAADADAAVDAASEPDADPVAVAVEIFHLRVAAELARLVLQVRWFIQISTTRPEHLRTSTDKDICPPLITKTLLMATGTIKRTQKNTKINMFPLKTLPMLMAIIKKLTTTMKSTTRPALPKTPTTSIRKKTRATDNGNHMIISKTHTITDYHTDRSRAHPHPHSLPFKKKQFLSHS